MFGASSELASVMEFGFTMTSGGGAGRGALLFNDDGLAAGLYGGARLRCHQQRSLSLTARHRHRRRLLDLGQHADPRLRPRTGA